MPKKLIKDDVIKRFKNIYNDKYDYSLFDYELENNTTIITPICPIHGKFEVTVANHLKGRGCPKCAGKNFTNEEKIEKARLTHNNFYDYSKSDFSTSKNKTTIICPIHGEFLMDYDHHVNNKNGCPYCSKTKKLTTEEYIERARQIHGDKYDYSNVIYKSMHDYIYPTCKEHGIFKIQAQAHLMGQGCQKCKKTSLEEDILNLLKENNIDFLYQVTKNTFPWLNYLSLDFYIPKYNVAIECQGKQHFREGGWITDKKKREDYFDTQIDRDEKKFKLCQENNIRLLYYSNTKPKYEYFDEVYTDKNNIINKIKE